MRKMFAGILILAALAVGTIYGAERFEKEIDVLIDYVEATSILLSEGDYADAIKLLEHSVKRWRELESYTYIFIHHSKVDAVSDAYFDYLSAIRNSKSDDKGQRDKLIYYLKNVASQEKLSLGSIF